LNRAETTITRETVGHLAIGWKTPGGSRSPSVVGNAIFLGGDDVQARSVETGAVLWRTDIGFRAWGTPAYGHGILVAVGYRYDRGDDIIGLDASTGAVLWTRPLHGKFSAAPSISGGTVYLGYTKAGGNGVAALKLRSGGIRWRWTSPSLNYVSSPTTDGSSVYFSFEGGTHVVSLDAATGALRWDRVLDPPVDLFSGMVSLQGDRLFAADFQGNLYALDAATGAIVWQKYLHGGALSPITTTPRRLFVIVSGNTLLAVSTADGATRWGYSCSCHMSPAAPVAGGVVYVGTRSDSVLAFDSRTGAQLYELRGNGWAAIPTVSNGRLFVSDGGKLVMLSLSASARHPIQS
jgi:outer membrane protein assembly factor BamB